MKFDRFSLILLILSSLPALGSCTLASTDAGDPPAVRVDWSLTSPDAELPTDVTTLVLRICEGDATGADCDSNTRSLGSLDTGADGRRRLVQPSLPYRIPFSLFIDAYNEAEEIRYVGQVGPLVLGEGERRFINVRMYSTDSTRATAMAASEWRGAWLHTATRLVDGRILIAGGFNQNEAVDCPEDLNTLPMGTLCFSLTASSDAYVFDISTGDVVALRNPMLRARAGHTATALTDGRVLLAGGASAALLTMQPVTGVDGAYEPVFLTRDVAGEATASDTFELFDPYGDAMEDPDRRGDRARGTFLGAAGTPSSPGRMNHARFMHAAAARPDVPSQVILAGGIGSADSSQSYDVFDNAKAGGYGIYQGGGTLQSRRTMPSAIAIGTRIWIIGGAAASSNADLAEVWGFDAANVNGATSAAASFPGSAFPSSTTVMVTDRPEYALDRPAVGSLDNGQRLHVHGWYGPRCTSMTPAFDATVRCDASEVQHDGNLYGSYTTEDVNGLTLPTASNSPHAFGASAMLSDGRMLVSGGAGNLEWNAIRQIDIFGATSVGNRASSAGTAFLNNERLFHSATALPENGMVFFGGATFTLDDMSVMGETSARIDLVESFEVLFF